MGAEYGPWKFNVLVEDWKAAKTRLSLYSIVGLLTGVFALLWAGHTLLQHRRGGGQVSKHVVLLLLSDILEVLLIPLVVASLLHDSLCSADGFDCFGISCLLGATRLWGLCFHQLVALEGLSHCFLCSCFSTFYAVLLFTVLLFWCLSIAAFGIISKISAALVILLYAGCIVKAVIMALTFKPSCCDPHPRAPQRPGLSVLVVAIFTLVFLYSPFLAWLVWFVVSQGLTARVDFSDFFPFGLSFSCLMSFRIVADSLLCVLVCREIPKWKSIQKKAAEANKQEAELESTLRQLLLT